MVRNYEYGTSPRKIEPVYTPKKKTKNENKAKIEEKQKKNYQEVLKERRRNHKNIAIIVGIFLILLAVSYRNSLITERFNEIQDKKNQLASIEKTNEQLEVSIESSLNLSNLEEEAQKKLGMQKLDNSQKVYVTLPKKDYTESNTEKEEDSEDSNWILNFIDSIFNK